MQEVEAMAAREVLHQLMETRGCPCKLEAVVGVVQAHVAE
jgi:hypothetical protein